MDEQEFGTYLLLKKLTAGGMGEIFLAKRRGPEGFEKLVVIKRLLPQFCSDPRFIANFLNEARLAAQLRHPNITQIYDLGKMDETYYICMEYVDGPNLREFIRAHNQATEPLPISAAVWICAKIFNALDYAHERAETEGRPLNIIHQDISPPNVLLSREGEVKLTDFGLAKATLSGEETTMGILRGKFPYMSPEHVAGHPQEKPSDIYATGVILFELLTGVPPFRETGSPLKLLSDIRFNPAPDPRRFRNDIPEALCDLLVRLLAKDPDDRPENAHQALSVLETLPDYKHFSERELTRMVLHHVPLHPLSPGPGEATQRAVSPLKQSARNQTNTRPSRPRAPAPSFFTPFKLLFMVLSVCILAGVLTASFKPQVFRQTVDRFRAGQPSPAQMEAHPETIPSRGKTIRLTSSPNDVSIYLDGKWVGNGTPVELDELLPGSPHELRLEKSGHVPWQQSVVIPSDLKEPLPVHARLVPKTASITLEFTPSPLRISWDGTERLETSPLTLKDIQPFTAHPIRAEAEGFFPETYQVVLDAGEKRLMHLDLRPMPALLDLTSDPEGAGLQINGKPSGKQTPIFSLSFVPGKVYTLLLTKDGYESWENTFHATAGSKKTVQARLNPLVGGLRIDSTPWADVFLDREHLGRTPFLSGEIPAGAHHLQLVNQERALKYDESLLIPQGITIKKRYTFNGTLDLSEVPAGLEVYLDNKFLGKSPVSPRRLPVGNYELTLRHPASRTDRKLWIRISLDKRTRVQAR